MPLDELPSLSSITLASSSNSYDNFAGAYDELNGNGDLMKATGIASLRLEAGALATGNVLEIGIGTGLQVPYYQWDQIDSFVGVDASRGMLEKTQKRLFEERPLREATQEKVKLVVGDAINLSSLKDNQFDTSVDTFSLCVLEDPRLALREMVRVTKPGGRLILVENSISQNVVLAFMQNILEPLITPFSKGCKWNVDVPSLAAESGQLKSEGNGKNFFSGLFMLESYRVAK